MITSPFDVFGAQRKLQRGRRIRREEGAAQFVPSEERVVTFKIPPSWGSEVNQGPLTHKEKYGWDPVEARKEYGFGGKDGTPAFKGYFG